MGMVQVAEYPLHHREETLAPVPVLVLEEFHLLHLTDKCMERCVEIQI